MSEGLKTILIHRWREDRPEDGEKIIIRMPRKDGGHIVSMAVIMKGTAKIETTNVYMNVEDIPAETEWFYASQAGWN